MDLWERLRADRSNTPTPRSSAGRGRGSRRARRRSSVAARGEIRALAVMNALSHDREERTASARAFADALRSALAPVFHPDPVASELRSAELAVERPSAVSSSGHRFRPLSVAAALSVFSIALLLGTVIVRSRTITRGETAPSRALRSNANDRDSGAGGVANDTAALIADATVAIVALGASQMAPPPSPSADAATVAIASEARRDDSVPPRRPASPRRTRLPRWAR